eukprot:GHVR01193209.1.p1 GENE.GHVR01193209.1~~GHVR01193209.1.p1  ORF type:complete len:110 (-),score=46.54 GHVR01193209.1:37-366(-)
MSQNTEIVEDNEVVDGFDIAQQEMQYAKEVLRIHWGQRICEELGMDEDIISSKDNKSVSSGNDCMHNTFPKDHNTYHNNDAYTSNINNQYNNIEDNTSPTHTHTHTHLI